MAFKLPKPDQEKAIQAIFDFYASGQTKDRYPLIGMPTGYGKSLVIAEFVKRLFHYWSSSRIIIGTHRAELIEQNRDTLVDQWSTAPFGICSAGLGSRDTMQPIIIGGIKSLINVVQALGFRHLMIIDEAHLVSPEAETQYRKFIALMREINPYFTVIGLSATLYRAGSGPLTEAEGGLFTEVIFDCTSLHEFNRILDEGWLCRLIPKMTQTELSIEGVGWSNGDFDQHDAQAAVDKDEITLACCRETIVQKAIERRNSCLIFAQGVAHAEHIVECLQSLGHHALAVHEKISKDQRRERIWSFKNGTLPYLVNNDVLTTGFDFPGLDMGAIMRLIGSPGLWVQILGRYTRPLYAPGWPISYTDVSPEACQMRLAAIAASAKPNGLVLDFGGNTKRLGPINDPVIPKRRGKRAAMAGIAPIKICPMCGVYNHASVMRCGGCDVEFSREQKLSMSASSDELIRSTEPMYETRNVTGVFYGSYQKDGTPPIMKVTYYDGPISVVHKEYVCFEHVGFGKKEAGKWWLQHSFSTPPQTVAEALEQKEFLKQPKQIVLRTDLDHPKIVDYIWKTEEENA